MTRMLLLDEGTCALSSQNVHRTMLHLSVRALRTKMYSYSTVVLG